MTIDAKTTDAEANLQGQQQAEAGVNSDSSTEIAQGAESSNDFQSRINKVTAQKWENHRRADSERKRADDLQAELEALKSKQSNPSQDLTVPSMPEDLYDQEAMNKYHSDMIQYSQEMAKKAAESTYSSYEQRQKEAQAKQLEHEAISNWQKNAQNAGVDLEKLHSAEQSIAQVGIDASLANRLMNDRSGPKIVEYLADNPALMHEVLAMEPMSAAIKIETEIKQKALSTTPSVSNAPAPTPEFKGGGFQETESFKKRYPNSKII